MISVLKAIAQTVLGEQSLPQHVCLFYPKEGYKVGLIRPLIASPFPYADYENINFDRVKGILDVEMSIPALMKWDVEHAVRGRTPIRECLRSGGNIMTKEKVLAEAHALIKEVLG